MTNVERISAPSTEKQILNDAQLAAMYRYIASAYQRLDNDLGMKSLAMKAKLNLAGAEITESETVLIQHVVYSTLLYFQEAKAAVVQNNRLDFEEFGKASLALTNLISRLGSDSIKIVMEECLELQNKAFAVKCGIIKGSVNKVVPFASAQEGSVNTDMAEAA